MIRNEDAYYTGYYRNVRELGAVPALVFDTIAGLLRATDGIGEINNDTLCELIGITVQYLRPIIKKLIASGYIEKQAGVGRGNKSIYYITEKGKQNIPFYAQKRETIRTEKGKQIVSKRETKPTLLNKVLNKELKESGGVSREAQSPTLSDTTPQKKETMEDFELWWSLDFGKQPEWEWRKAECERAWYAMQMNWRDNLVQMARENVRWRKKNNDDPFWYICNYEGQPAQRELPFYRQGTPKFGKWLDEQEKAGRDIAIMRYEGTLAFCLVSDRDMMEAAGAQFVSIMSRRTRE